MILGLLKKLVLAVDVLIQLFLVAVLMKNKAYVKIYTIKIL